MSVAEEYLAEWWNKHDGSTPNKSKNSIAIKKEIEKKGFSNVFVWWENLGPEAEMGGPTGGYMMVCEEASIYPLGYCLADALEVIASEWFALGSFAFPWDSATINKDGEE